MTEDINEEVKAEFASRNLNDTRYITKYVVSWLKKEFKQWEIMTGEVIETVVQSINGRVTSRFRRNWLINSPWGLEDKVREITPFHHAVDAIVLTQFINFSYVTFASDIANISNLKNQLHHKRLSQEDYFQACDEILMKWKSNKTSPEGYKAKGHWTSKVNLFVPNAYNRLQDIVQKTSQETIPFAPLVKNLKEIIEKRIPVELKRDKREHIIKINDEEKKYERPAPKFVKVLSKEEYLERAKDMKGDIHYPFISYKINRKLTGDIFSSENIKSKDKAFEDDKLKDSFRIDSKGSIWEVNKYFAVVMNYESDKLKPIWIRNIDAKKELINYSVKDLIIHNDVIEYFDKKEQQNKIKVFKGKRGASVYAHLMGTINIQNNSLSSKIFNKPNYYDRLSNWSKYKKLYISILGKEI